MEKKLHHQDIAFLIYKEQTSELTPDEICLLEKWKSEEESNRALYERVVVKNNWSEDIRRYEHIDSGAAWRKYIQRYPLLRKKKILFLRISASVGIAVSVLLAIVLIRNHPQRDVTTLAQRTELINPGTSKATLILDNGESVDLSTSENHKIDIHNSATAINTGNQICYSSNEEEDTPAKENERYNTIVVPRAGEYKIILSDGTSVWLNAQTTLKYPIHFSGKTRTVYLQGEAYFDVAANEEKPFIVALQNNVAIRAIGTAFNIRDYAAEGKVQTVLEEGKIEMKTSEGEYIMTPSMAAEYNRLSHQTDLQVVNTELYTAWRQGRYIFLDETLIGIFRRLADWYDISIVYENEEVKNRRYSGNVMRRETVNGFLNAIEESGGVRFEINGKTVKVFSEK